LHAFISLETYYQEYLTSSTQATASTEQTRAKTSTKQSIPNPGKETEGRLQSKAVTVTSDDDVESLVRGLEEHYTSTSAV
jgi:hypothetical protein